MDFDRLKFVGLQGCGTNNSQTSHKSCDPAWGAKLTMSGSESPSTKQASDSTPIASDITAPSQSMSFWGAIRESLRGSRQDYTIGPIGRSIILLAIPMVLEMCMESVFAVVP